MFSSSWGLWYGKSDSEQKGQCQYSWAFPSLSLTFSLLFPSLSHSFIHIHFSLWLLLSFSPALPSFLLPFLLPHFLSLSLGTEIGLWFFSSQALSSAFNFGGSSCGSCCHGDCTVQLRWPHLQSPKQCAGFSPFSEHFCHLMRLVASNERCILTQQSLSPSLLPPHLCFLPPSTFLIY